MFRRFCIDPFNWDNNRNITNTDKSTYNCAGYALGTYSWYCPHDEDKTFLGLEHYRFNSPTEAFARTMECVEQMVNDFQGKLRLIGKLAELDEKTERVVAFRISSDGDFHYIKKGANGQWYHKMGRSPYIDKMPESTVLGGGRWCGRYNGPVVLLAIKK